ncbi:MAG: sugar ABC transporter substrate-binding protein [Thermotogaceae bacterium]|nr:sugar ABC transporter substrate-binding protein [Thermotogaceae bacterium]
MRKVLLVALLFISFALVFSEKKVTLIVQDYFNKEDATARFIDNVLIPEFEKRFPEVEVKHVFIPFAELLPTILQQAVTGTLPDIIMADNPWVPQLIEAGVYKDITDLVMEDLGESFWNDFFEGHRLVTSKDGRIYALQLHTNNLALFYRRSLLEKAGVEKVPETWDELLEACKKIKEKLGIYGFAMCAPASEEGTWQFEPFLWTNGGSLFELDQPPAIEALEFLTELVEKGYMPRDVVNVSGQGDLSIWFINGEVAMMVNGNWEFGWHLTPDVLEKLGDVGVAPLPVPKKGMKALVPFGGECYGISSTIDSKKLKYAWEFLKMLYVEKIEEYYVNWTGHIPTRASYAEKIAKLRPMLKPFLEQAKYAIPRPLVGGIDKYPDVSKEVALAIQRAFTGVQTPEEAFKEAAKNIKGLFSPKEFEKFKKMARDILDKTRERMLREQ